MTRGGGPGSPGAARRAGPALLLLAGFAASAPCPATAAPSRPPISARAPVDPRAAELAALAADLGGSDVGRLAAGLAQLAGFGKAPGPIVALLERRLAEGLPPTLALVAIDALGKQGSATSGPALKLYVRHRDPVLRKAAVAAVARALGAPAEDTLRAALLDASPETRAEAARALVSLELHAAVADLLSAFDRGTREAGEAFAALCREQECDAVTLRTGLWPLVALAPAIRAMLLRSAAGVSDAQKIALVVRLRAVATAEAIDLLRQLLGALTPSVSGPVRAALAEAAGAGGPSKAGER